MCSCRYANSLVHDNRAWGYMYGTNALLLHNVQTILATILECVRLRVLNRSLCFLSTSSQVHAAPGSIWYGTIDACPAQGRNVPIYAILVLYSRLAKLYFGEWYSIFEILIYIRHACGFPRMPYSADMVGDAAVKVYGDTEQRWSYSRFALWNCWVIITTLFWAHIVTAWHFILLPSNPHDTLLYI